MQLRKSGFLNGKKPILGIKKILIYGKDFLKYSDVIMLFLFG